MVKGKRTIKWRSTFKESLGEFLSHSLNDHEKDVFCMLFNGFGVPQKLQSTYFEYLRAGNGKYTLSVQKYVTNVVHVTFEINPNYTNVLKKFTS